MKLVKTSPPHFSQSKVREGDSEEDVDTGFSSRDKVKTGTNTSLGKDDDAYDAQFEKGSKDASNLASESTSSFATPQSEEGVAQVP